MSAVDDHIDVVDNSDLPEDTIETATAALAFAQSFNDLLVDLGVIADSDELDFELLEKSFESFMGEVAAAGLFLATFKSASTMLRGAADKLKGSKEVPPLIVNGYYKLADRVEKTMERVS